MSDNSDVKEIVEEGADEEMTIGRLKKLLEPYADNVKVHMSFKMPDDEELSAEDKEKRMTLLKSIMSKLTNEEKEVLGLDEDTLNPPDTEEENELYGSLTHIEDDEDDEGNKILVFGCEIEEDDEDGEDDPEPTDQIDPSV